MNDEILKDISVGVIALSLALGAVVLIGASLYDFKRARKFAQASTKKTRTRRPLITAVVYSDGETEPAITCAQSVLASRHRKVEVIIVNNNPDTAAPAEFKQWADGRPKRGIKIINKRKPASLDKAITSALKAAKGKIIVLLGSDMMLEKTALGKAADKLSTNPSIAVIPEIMIAQEPTTLNLWIMYKALLRANWQKTASLMNPAGSGLHFGVFYSQDVARDRKTAKKYEYDADIELYRRARTSIAHTSTPAYKLALADKTQPTSVIEPVVDTVGFIYRVLALPIFTWYGLYLALNRGYSYILFLGWAVFTFIYIFVIWTEGNMASRAKARLSALAPAVFSLAIFMVFVEAAARLILPLSKRLSRT